MILIFHINFSLEWDSFRELIVYAMQTSSAGAGVPAFVNPLKGICSRLLVPFSNPAAEMQSHHSTTSLLLRSHLRSHLGTDLLVSQNGFIQLCWVGLQFLLLDKFRTVKVKGEKYTH